MSVTIELIDSMLAPSASTPANQQQTKPPTGEKLYQSIPLSIRVRDLASLLTSQRLLSTGTSSSNDATTAATNAAGRTMMVAVLLRKEITALAGSQKLTGLSAAQSIAIMGDVAEPLLALFTGGGGAAQEGVSCRQVGHCIAELCGSLSVISPEHGREWMKSVLERLQPGCTAMDTSYLKLLISIAEQSPITLWSVGDTSTFSSLLPANPTTLEQLEAALGALCQVGIAYEKAKRLDSTSGSKESDLEQRTLLAQLPENCTAIHPNSPPAQLGRALLPQMLATLVHNSTAAHAQGNLELLSKCMAHLSTCSNQCPSLVAGDEPCLLALMRCCMSIAQIANSSNDEDVTFLRLAALDVVATITAVPTIKLWIMKPLSAASPASVAGGVEQGTMSPLLQFLLQGRDAVRGDAKGILYLCAELSVMGVDDDEEEWSKDPAKVEDTEASWEEDHIALHAESLLESFVENLGGTSTLPSIFQLVDSLLTTSQSWRNQRAVLSILERCLAAAPVTFVPHVEATVDVALRLIPSGSARVQYQSLQLLGSLCCANSVADGANAVGTTQQQVIVREKYGGTILEAVSHLIKSLCTKVASHACLTVVSYCRGGNGSENCRVPIEKGLIVPYVGNLLDALRSGPLAVDLSDPNSISEGSLTVLIRAIGAVACLADAAGEDFLPHYSIISGLTACALFGLEKSEQGIKLRQDITNTHEKAMLRGSAIEAASIIGQAISGPDGENVSTYATDASEMMTIATTLLSSGDTDAIPMDQLLAACARIAAVMGSQYVQFMPSVLPHILQRATEKLEISITEDENGNGNESTADEGCNVSIPGMSSKKVKINTTQLEEKAQSARALYEHARALGKDFGPFVEASATAFLPLVNCDYSSDVRSTSAQALCQIFKAACLSAVASDPANNARGPAQILLPVLAKALTKQLEKEIEEDDTEIRYAIADALSEVLWDAFEHTTANGERVAQVAVADAREIVWGLMSLLQSCLLRRSAVLSEMADYSFDNDEIARCEERLQAEAEYLTHLVDSVGYQLKTLGEGFAPIFEESVAGPLGKILNANHDARAKLAAVCLFDDCVEHCGSSAANTYAPVLLQGINDTLSEKVNHGGDVELKQAAVYGIAQVARHAPKSLSPVLGKELLMKVYNIAKEVETVAKGDIEYAALIENAVSSLASLALLHGSPLCDSISDKGPLIKVFLCGLPLEEDFAEAKICHNGLCDLVESNMIDLQNHHTTLLRIIGKILALVSEGDDVASESTCTRLTGVIGKIQLTVDANLIQVAFSAMEPDVQQALSAAAMQ